MGTRTAVAVETDLAVRHLLARCAHLMDDANREGVAGLFVPEGQVIFGKTHHVGREGILAWLSTATGGGLHQVTNVAVSRGSTDGTFHAVSDLTYLRRENDLWSPAFVGRYHDTFVEDGADLRFTQRIVTPR